MNFMSQRSTSWVSLSPKDGFSDVGNRAVRGYFGPTGVVRLVRGNMGVISNLDGQQKSPVPALRLQIELSPGALVSFSELIQLYPLFFRPGSKNGKQDALSFLHSDDTLPTDPEPIMPFPQIIGATTWEIETIIQTAQSTHPDPGTGPPNHLFVLEEFRSQVLKWGHSSKLSCHPGAQRTLQFLH